MLDGLKRLFSRSPSAPHGFEAVAGWAQGRGHTFRPLVDDDGFAVEGRLSTWDWRLEWGAPQRPYVEGRELRLRADLGLDGDVQAMLLDRTLQSTMEKALFEQYVESVQTRIDDTTPPEMRWLVMFSKLGHAELGPLRDRFAAVGSSKPWVMGWLQGGLTQALLSAPMLPTQPFVLMVARGRLVLRTELSEPNPDYLEAWLTIFETAMREARRVVHQGVEGESASTQPSLFSAAPSILPGSTRTGG